MDWITCSDPTRELWRHLLEFTNADFTVDRLENVHGAERANRQNYRKQASQIRVSLLQAREYFDATANASLYTAPNHLYYGAVSLASAIMLLRGDGNNSLDNLRRKVANRNHGLDFSTGAQRGDCSTRATLLEKSFVAQGETGHFRNWYARLPSDEPYIGIVRKQYPQGSFSILDKICSRSIERLTNVEPSKRSLFHLIAYLPDFALDLRRVGIRVSASRTTVEKIEDAQSRMISIKWLVHNPPHREALESILWRFAVHPHQIAYVDSLEVADLGAEIRLGPAPHEIAFRAPCVRTMLNGDAVAFGADLPMPELADAYQAAFGLSMLARYYPDLWIACLESHCLAAKIIDQFVGIYAEKFPLLVLNALRHDLGGPIFFSTQSAPHKR